MTACSACSAPCGDPPMRCPTCLKYGVDTPFCNQECFKKNWATHKSSHKEMKLDFQRKELQRRLLGDPGNMGLAMGGAPVNTTEVPEAERMNLPPWASSFSFAGSLKPAMLSPTRVVKDSIKRPDYANHPEGASACEEREKRGTDMVEYKKGSEELENLRYACAMGREVLDEGGKACRVGATTDEIDRVVHEACMERDCYPSPLNYYNFPKSVCTSINEIICHGIPDYREIQDGDICNIDVTTFVRGMHGDLNETFLCGNVDKDGTRLVEVAFDCLKAALARVKPGTLYQDLWKFIQRTAEKKRCSVVKTYCGHGIGSCFHCRPNVPHYKNNRARGVMKEGHVFTVEPMINLGSHEDFTWGDNWSASTADGKRSAQFEHTVLCTKDGCEILTKREDEPVMLWDAAKNQR